MEMSNQTIGTDELLTSAEAASRLGVAVSTLKRWADHGRIEHVRTVGGHRRFRSTALERVGGGLENSTIENWISLLLSDADARTVVGELRHSCGTVRDS